jgi:molybdopterin-guanine dinucleotide biosynthesis protein A
LAKNQDGSTGKLDSLGNEDLSRRFLPTMNEQIVGVLLSGGQSRRMGGGDKCLKLLGDQTILEHVINRIRPQVGPLILNANGDPERFRPYGLPVVTDVVDGFAGPLAGILTGLRWTEINAPNCDWMLSVPTDAPFVPQNLAISLRQEILARGAHLACAESRGRAHPVVGMWPVALADELEQALVVEDIRKIDRWTSRYHLVEVAFDDAGIDPFFNVNRPENLATAERLLAGEC